MHGGLGSWRHVIAQLLALTKSGRVAAAGASGTSRLICQLFFDLLRHRVESHVDILGLLGTGLEEGHGELGGELLALLEGDLAAVLHIALVANEDLADARI